MMFFANARIFDGSGRAPFRGEVMVRGNRIAAVRMSDVDRTARAASDAFTKYGWLYVMEYASVAILYSLSHRSKTEREH